MVATTEATSCFENLINIQKTEAKNKKTIKALSFEFLKGFLTVFAIIKMHDVNYSKNNLGNCF